MTVSNRPPTTRMVIKLQECLNNGTKEPYLAENMKSSLSGLYKRGLVETRMELVHDKKLLCIYVSELGKKFLSDQSVV